MLLNYRDPRFWENFQTRHWRPRVPTVLRQPFKTFPFSEEAVVGAVNAVEKGLRVGDPRIRYIVSVGDLDKAPRRRLGELVRQENRSLPQLERNCGRVFPGQSFGLMLHELQALDPGIWSGISAFLQDAYPWLGFPVARAFLDLFFGNYARSFLGLHKDTQEIFAFVLRGEKKILAWPFEYFLTRAKGVSPGARYFTMQLAEDYRKYRKDAIVLDARPGDVIYWPSDYWHIAEAKPGQFSTMLSLGIFRQDITLSDPSSPQARFREKLVSPSLHSQDMSEVTARAGGAHQLRWVTGFGFDFGGPVRKTASRGDGEMTVKKTKNSLVLWKVSSSRGRLLVASNGHSVTFPHSSKLVALLERVARDETIRFPHDTRRIGAKLSASYESRWTPPGRLQTRARLSRQPPESQLLDWLLRVSAAEWVRLP